MEMGSFPAWKFGIGLTTSCDLKTFFFRSLNEWNKAPDTEGKFRKITIKAYGIR